MSQTNFSFPNSALLSNRPSFLRRAAWAVADAAYRIPGVPAIDRWFTRYNEAQTSQSEHNNVRLGLQLFAAIERSSRSNACSPPLEMRPISVLIGQARMPLFRPDSLQPNRYDTKRPEPVAIPIDLEDQTDRGRKAYQRYLAELQAVTPHPAPIRQLANT